MQKWNYLALKVDEYNNKSINDSIAKLGTQGWECFSVVPCITAEGGGTPTREFYFKRPVSSDPVVEKMLGDVPA